MVHDEIYTSFYEANTRELLAIALGTKPNRLAYYLFILTESERYKKKIIQKKSGKVRNVAAPIRGLKFIQRNLADILTGSLEQKSCVHGFVPDRSIVTNAKVHLRRNLVINLDLKDFFPSINFGRVYGLFKSHPFNFNDQVAVTLAQICCFEGSLPQGSPCSPVISNLICRSLDNEMMRLAKTLKMSYSRYADDITFSTNLKEIPQDIGNIVDGEYIPSEKLTSIIERNGFCLNKNKTRCRSRYQRQEVTGIVTNKKLNIPRNYVRRIRAMLHAWEAYGLQKAAAEHFSKYNKKRCDYPEASFKKRIAGMIGYVGMVKGRDSSVYINLFEKLRSIDETIRLNLPEYSGDAKIVVYCEGITDPMHLKAALRHFRSKGTFGALKIDFHMYRDDIPVGHGELHKIMEGRHLVKTDDTIEIYLFDNDQRDYVAKLNGRSFINFKHPKVFMALLPQPAHRDFYDVCIEHFYSDIDLMRKDAKGRRIFFSNEFDKTTGLHKTESVRCLKLQQLKQKDHTLLVEGILNEKDQSVALSKKDFALAVLNRKQSHADINLDAFKVIFEMFENIYYSCI